MAYHCIHSFTLLYRDALISFDPPYKERKKVENEEEKKVENQENIAKEKKNKTTNCHHGAHS